MSEAEVSPSLLVEILRVVSVGHCQLCEGQDRELRWRRDGYVPDSTELRDMFILKTSTAFDVALRVGALLAGGSQDLRRALSDIASPLGVLYQLLDDVADQDGVKNPPAVLRTFLEMIRVAVLRVPDSAVRRLLEDIVPMMLGATYITYCAEVRNEQPTVA